MNKKTKTELNTELNKKIAELESLNDQLITELRNLEDLLKRVGFDSGLDTLKKAALEILEEPQAEEDSEGEKKQRQKN